MADTDFELVEPFDIDGGELDGVSPSECFCLGVEFALLRRRILDGESFTTLSLANNARRLASLAERHGRFVEWHPTETPGWAEITVGGNRE